MNFLANAIFFDRNSFVSEGLLAPLCYILPILAIVRITRGGGE